MKIVKREMKETIVVFHNSMEELEKSEKDLMDKGWSENIRSGGTGAILYTLHLEPYEVEVFMKENHPEVFVQPPEEGNFLRSKPYVYCTRHERLVEPTN